MLSRFCIIRQAYILPYVNKTRWFFSCQSMNVGLSSEVREGREAIPYTIIARTKHRTITSNGDACNRHVIFRDEMMCAFILSQIPYAKIPSTITTDEFALIGMDDDVIDGESMIVIPLHASRSSIPDLHRSILRARHHPFPLAMKPHPGHVRTMPLEGEDGVGIVGFDVKQLDRKTTGCGQEALVG